MSDPSIFLMGFMGCGKSSTGQKLAASLSRPFADLDDLIEKNDGRSIRNIFFEEGEAWFRKLETETLYSLGQDSPSVIALGGGTPCFGRNMQWIKSHSYSVFLKVAPGELVRRLNSQKLHRPLIRDLDEEGLNAYIQNTLLQRNPFYEQADLHLDASGKTVDDLVNEISVHYSRHTGTG